MKSLSQKLLEDVTANTGHYPNGDNEIPSGTRTSNGGEPASPKTTVPTEFALPKEVSDAVRAMLSTHKSLDDQQNKSDVDLIWDLSQWMRTENISNQDEYIGFLIKHGMPENLAHQLLAILGVEVKAPGSEAKEDPNSYKVGDKIKLVSDLMKLPKDTKGEVVEIVGNFVIIQVKGIKYSVHGADILKTKSETLAGKLLTQLEAGRNAVAWPYLGKEAEIVYHPNGYQMDVFWNKQPVGRFDTEGPDNNIFDISRAEGFIDIVKKSGKLKD